MSDNKRRIDRVLEEGFLTDLSERSLDEIRAMRLDAAEEEAICSYERRLLHGRLAILRREVDRRAGTRTGSIIDTLPEILADESRASRGSFPGNDPNIAFTPSRRVSKLVNDDTLARLDALSDDELRARIKELEEVERDVSETRRSVLAVLDALNEEIGRRYRTGEANPNDVLTGR
ncbi:MAG: aerial mycelium formation protein [Actinomycetota bacterium]